MTSTTSYPFTNFRGGKGRAYQHLINLMPPHDRYVESHLGGGAVLRYKRPARRSVAIDIDPSVVAAWRDFPLNGFELLEGDASTYLPQLNLASSDLVYADPPYVPSTRRTSRYYRHDYGDDDHLNLLGVLRSLDCMVVLSGYRGEMYDRELVDWHRIDYEAVTHRGVVSESAWTNFKPGNVLHDYSYVGSTFRQREAFRRRLERLVRQLEVAGPLERNAALARVATTDPDAIIAASRRIGCP